MQARDVVRSNQGGPHPAVVLTVEGDLARVIQGTGTERAHRAEEDPYKVIEFRSQAGTAMGLDKDTCFPRSGAHLVTVASLSPWMTPRRTPGRCPPNVFVELKALLE